MDAPVEPIDIEKNFDQLGLDSFGVLTETGQFATG